MHILSNPLVPAAMVACAVAAALRPGPSPPSSRGISDYPSVSTHSPSPTAGGAVEEEYVSLSQVDDDGNCGLAVPAVRFGPWEVTGNNNHPTATAQGEPAVFPAVGNPTNTTTPTTSPSPPATKHERHVDPSLLWVIVFGVVASIGSAILIEQEHVANGGRRLHDLIWSFIEWFRFCKVFPMACNSA